MYIRCVNCRASTLIQHVSLSAPSRLTCGSCGRHYEVRDSSRLGTSKRDGYENAQAYASDHQIDLPSAYSVLLGVMSLDQARELPPAKKSGPRPPVPTRSTKPGDETLRAAATPTESDPPEDAVLQDLASAIETAPTASSASDHGACEAGTPTEPQADREPPRRRITKLWRVFTRALNAPTLSPLQRVIVTVCLVLLILFTGIYSRKVWRMQASVAPGTPPIRRSIAARPTGGHETVVPQPAATHTSAATQIVRNDQGAMTAVFGPDPQSVLRAFCSSTGDGTELIPLEVAAGDPSSPDVRIGLFRRGTDGDPSAILIRLDPAGDRWTAGDGDAAIAVQPATAIPNGPPRTTTLDSETATNVDAPDEVLAEPVR